MEQLMQQNITLSPDWDVVWQGNNTVLKGVQEIPVKLVIWYDSLVCSSCQLSRMYEWNNIVTYADSLASWFSIIYLFTPKIDDIDRVNVVLKTNNFDYPLFIDRNSSFIKQNPNLPKNRRLHSFLLDKNNRVVLLGNPLYNPALWALYKRTIQEMIDNDGVLPDR